MSNLDQSKPLVYDLDLHQYNELFQSWGEPSYRASQMWQGLFKHYWDNPGSFTSFPLSLREQLSENLSFNHLTPITAKSSSDYHTEKTLFQLPDSNFIETVLMKYKTRRTLCISTQSGCGMGCVFCATGQMGLMRNLLSGEIVEQVMHYARILGEKNERVTNIVFMGMGEPFHNYNATMRAIDTLNHPDGINLGGATVTISTVGLIPAIKRFALEKRQVNLAVSLHSVDNTLRSSMLPINNKYPVDELLHACKEYVEQTGRRLSFEWALIDDLNDTTKQASELARKLLHFKPNSSMLYHVNVIPLNPTDWYNGNPSSHAKASAFRDILIRNGISCTIRLRRGIDIQAGCGQLATETNRNN